MTHPRYLEDDGGFLKQDAPFRIYALALGMGVRDFVVPGNKPERITMYRELFRTKLAAPVLYSPGLVTQGGDISESGKAAGQDWHAICGRAVYNPLNRKSLDEVTIEEMRESLQKLVSKV